MRRSARPEPAPGGYRDVLADRPFLHLAATNMAVIAIGWGVISWVVPPYARAQLGVGPEPIGLLLLAKGASMLALDRRLPRAARLTPALGSRHAVHAQEPQGGPGGHRVQVRRPS